MLQNGFPNLYNEKVPVSRHILIHAGVEGKDTLGCLLPATNIIKEKGVIVKTSNSRKMFFKIIDKIEEIGIENIKIIIKDEIK